MRRLGVAILVAVTATAIAKAEKCAAPPLSLPYRNVSVSPGVLTRGIPLQLGSPFQSVALTPSLQLDHTFIPRFTNTCIYNTSIPTNIFSRLNLTARAEAAPALLSAYEWVAGGGNGDLWRYCASVYGGAYAPSLSATYKQSVMGDMASEPWFNSQGWEDGKYVNETWRFTDYIDVYIEAHNAVPAVQNLSSTFIITDEGKSFGGLGASLLGLTPNSSLLRGLYEAKVAPSLSWSLGRKTLCLGCVDETAYTGALHTVKPSDPTNKEGLPCILQVKVEAMNWHPKPSAEGATIIEEAFTACVDPGVDFLVLPESVRTAFGKIVGGVQAEFEDAMVVRGSNNEGNGILTVGLEGGLQVNVTLPVSGTGNAGSSSVDVAIGKGGWGAYGNSTPVLGSPFTDAILLQWDSSTSLFGLATKNSDPSRKSSVKPLGCSSFPSVPKPSSAAATVGITVGASIGSFLGGLVFAFTGFWFFKRGQRGVKARYEQIDDGSVPMRTMSSGGRTADSLMSGALSPPPASIRSGTTGSRPEVGLGFEVADSALFEAPEGGTAYPVKRERQELMNPTPR